MESSLTIDACCAFMSLFGCGSIYRVGIQCIFMFVSLRKISYLRHRKLYIFCLQSKENTDFHLNKIMKIKELSVDSIDFIKIEIQFFNDNETTV